MNHEVELAQRWVSAADIVSFDLTRSLFPLLGLDWAPTERFADAMRDALSREWTLEQESPDVWIDFPELCRTVLKTHVGEDLLAHYERWLTRQYGLVVWELPQWFALRTAFIFFARNPKAFGLSRQATAAVADLYEEIMDLGDIDNTLDARRNAVLSDWDVALLARRGQHINREGDDLADAGDILAPLRRIALTQRLQAFCREVVAALPPDQLALLNARIAHWGETRGFEPEGGFRPLEELVAEVYA